jgi:hypothetical protein
MKRSIPILALVTCFSALAASVALAAGPIPGLYRSIDLGGAVLLGRASQSWAQPLNAQNGVSDVYNAQSWNGSVAGTQWVFRCGIQPAAQLVQDNRDGSGTGAVIFTNTFSGGTFWLSRFGPWGDGINDLTGTVGTTREIVTVTYVSGIPFESRINMDAAGLFDGSSCVLRFVISNGVGGGDTDLLPKPADYPDFLDTACGPNRIFGSWGDVKDIAMYIDCPVDTHRSTWGKVKQLYR